METHAFFSVGVKTTLKNLHTKLNNETSRFIYSFLLSLRVWGSQLIIEESISLNDKFHKYQSDFISSHSTNKFKNELTDIEILNIFFTFMPKDIYNCHICLEVSDRICDVRRYHDEKDHFFLHPGLTVDCMKVDMNFISENIKFAESYCKTHSTIDFEIVFMNTLRTRLL